MSEIKYKPYVKFYFSDPTNSITAVEEIYTGNGNIVPVEAELGVFFGDEVNTGFSDIAYLDFRIQSRFITETFTTLTASITNPIGFLWVRVLDKDDLYDNGKSFFDFAGVIRRAAVVRHTSQDDSHFQFYFEVQRTRCRDFYDLRKAVPDPFDYQ